MKFNPNLNKQTKSSKPKLKDRQQINPSSTQIKIAQLQKEISNLNLNIDYLILEKQFKLKFSQLLIKQRQKLQNSFLYKNSKRQSGKNHFTNINDRINALKSQIKSSQTKSLNKTSNKNALMNQQQQNNMQKKPLPCQSLHLQQLFTKKHSLEQQTKSQLLQKRQQLYKKISILLSTEQPYLHQKLLQRIKRRAIHQSKLLLEKEIQKLIKENSSWIRKETSKVSHQIDQQDVEQCFMINIQLMKRIMSKKVQNNDFIYQNYHHHTQSNQNHTQSNRNHTESYQNLQQQKLYQVISIKSIQKNYQQVLKKIKSNKINDNLNIIDKKFKNTKSSELLQLMQSSCIKKLLKQDQSSQQLEQLKISQKNLLTQCDRIHFQLQKLI